MIGTPDQDAFVRSMKWAVVTSLRRDGSPSNSVIFFALDGDQLMFSTTSTRVKGKTLKRDPRAAVTVLDEGPPYRFVTIEGPASIEYENILEDHIKLNRAWRGGEWQPPEGYLESLRAQSRVIVRVAARRVSGVVNRG